MTRSIFLPPSWNFMILSTKDHCPCSPKVASFCQKWCKINNKVVIFPAMCRGCELTHTSRNLTCRTLWMWAYPYRQRRNLTCCTLWVWGHPYRQRGNLKCRTLWVWGHPYRQRGNLKCRTLWVWGHPYFFKRQTRFLTRRTSWSTTFLLGFLSTHRSTKPCSHRFLWRCAHKILSFFVESYHASEHVA